MQERSALNGSITSTGRIRLKYGSHAGVTHKITATLLISLFLSWQKEVNTMRGIPKENLVHIMVSVKATDNNRGVAVRRSFFVIIFNNPTFRC